MDQYEKISELILYISNATIDQYLHLLVRFASIQVLDKIVLKIDTSSQFFNENSKEGTTSILTLIKQFKEKLPSLKDLQLIFRTRDFSLLSESL